MNCLSSVTLHLVGGKSLSSTIAEKLCHSILSKIIVFFLFDLNPRPSTPPPSFDSVFVKMVGLLILEELGQLYQNKSLDNFSKLKANVLGLLEHLLCCIMRKSFHVQKITLMYMLIHLENIVQLVESPFSNFLLSNLFDLT